MNKHMVYPNKNEEKPNKTDTLEESPEHIARMQLANRIFFRLYQCANVLHKTGTRAIDSEGLTTQQWAVLGALSHPDAKEGLSVGKLSSFLRVSRQNLSGLLGRMERDGHVKFETDGRDKRSRLVSMTDLGWHVWTIGAQPKIQDYYVQVLDGFSINDLSHTLHYLLKLLDNMQVVDKLQSEERNQKE